MRVLPTTVITLCLIGFHIPAFADDEVTTYELDIEAQALPGALKSFAEQTDLQVVYFAAVAEGKDAPALEGEFTADAALDQLLASAELEYQNVDARTYSIAPEHVDQEQRGASNSKNSQTAPVLMAQNQTSQTTTTSSSRASDEDATSVVTGKVTDARTGANLKGALVTIEETGQSTSTNDLGEFRFVNVPTGSATLTVSFLGYAGQSDEINVHGRAATSNFSMRASEVLDEIVVFGQRSARVAALNQQRVSEVNSEVVSADQLGQFTGTTISESLRRVSGVSFQRDAFSDEGANIIVRGLEPDLNSVHLNGLELPDGSGLGRSASLNNVLTESVSKITVSKTLLPSQDTTGSGAVIDIETKSPLDRPIRFLTIAADTATQANDFHDEVNASATASGKFGAERNFGLSASVQYRTSDRKRLNYNATPLFGQFLPLQADGSLSITSLAQVDPRIGFPFEPESSDTFLTGVFYSKSNTSIENLNATLGAAWSLGHHTNIRADYSHLESSRETYSQGIQFRTNVLNLPTPIVALGGEQRISPNGTFPAFGVNNPIPFLSRSFSYVPESEDRTTVLTLRGESKVNRWTLTYLIGATRGESETPQQLSAIVGSQNLGVLTDPATFGAFFDGFVLPAATDPTEQRIISVYRPRRDASFPLPLVTQDAMNILNSTSEHGFRSSSQIGLFGENERTTANFSARYDFDFSNLKYLEAGVYIESSDFDDERTAALTQVAVPVFDPFATYPTLASLGLGFDDAALSSIGIGGGFTFVPDGEFRHFMRNELQNLAQVDFDPNDPSTSAPGVIYRQTVDIDPRLLRSYTKEDEAAGFFQGRFDVGNLEVIGGVRISRVELEAQNLFNARIFDDQGQPDLAFEAENSTVFVESETQTEVLPRVLFNYRKSDDLIIRGGYFLSVARPQIQFLSNEASFTLDQAPRFGPSGNQPSLTVLKGNPSLKPAKTHSFDLSVELYHESGGLAKIGVFYKRIENFLQNNRQFGIGSLQDVVLPDDPRYQDVIANPNDYFVSVTVPTNSEDDGEIWGAEAYFEYQFTKLPGAWSGLGVLANYTYTESAIDQTLSWQGAPIIDNSGALIGTETIEVVIPNARFNEQPEHSGTLGLTYNLHNIDANLAYTGQSRRQTSFFAHKLHGFEESFETLDFRAEYFLDSARNGDYRIFLEARNLLDGSSDPTRVFSRGTGSGGVPKVVTTGEYFGGREFRLGIRATF